MGVAQDVQKSGFGAPSPRRHGHDQGNVQYSDRARISTDQIPGRRRKDAATRTYQGMSMSVHDPIVLEELGADAAPASGPSQLRAFTGLTAVQVLQLLAGFVTGPLIARALGADGRGLLAAIAVPLAIVPLVGQVGLGAFAVNRVAQGGQPGRVFGSLAVPLLFVGGLITVSAPWLADTLSEGREPVDKYLTIGFTLVPLSLLLNLLLDMAWGMSAWRVLALGRLLIAFLALVGIAVLYAMHELNVSNAAVVTIASAFAPVLVLLPVLRRIGRPRVDGGLMRTAVAFGFRAWPGTLASLANHRLDQLLMIPLVPARELGLYAVAVTVASLSVVLSSQLITVVLPRIAAGEHFLVPASMRALLLIVVATQICLAIGTLLWLVPIFGADFADARLLVLVLLPGWLAQAGVSTLGQSLAATGRPGAPSIGEIVSLVITVPGLILLLPPLGALGAALVTLVAYVVTFATQLIIAKRHFGHRISDYLLPRREDLLMIRQFARPFLARLRRS
jgi:O-antigen/teichoic acid export membrane protein